MELLLKTHLQAKLLSRNKTQTRKYDTLTTKEEMEITYRRHTKCRNRVEKSKIDP